MRLLYNALLIVCLIGCIFPQRSKGQKPEESAKRDSTHRDEKNKPTPSPQTIVIQSNKEPVSRRENEQPKTENTTKHPHDWMDKLNAFSTLVIAAFTVGMVAVISIQIREYRIRERSWVTFMDPQMRQRLKGGQPNGYEIVGVVKNVGNTPATIIKKFHFASIEGRKSLDSTPPYLAIEETQTEYLMVPGDTEPAIAEVSESEMLNIHQLTIHVLGQIVYKDVFGKIHETRYCLRYYHFPVGDHLRGFYPEGPSVYLKVT